MSLAPAALVVGATRVPLPYGLFSTFSLRPEGSDRWLTGVQWETVSCAPAKGFGDPACGVNEVQTITIGGAGLTGWTLTFGGQTTTPSLAPTAQASTVQARLEALSSIGPGNVLVTGANGGPYTVTFIGRLAGTDVALITANPTGGTGTVTPAQTTPGAPSGAATGMPKDLAKNTGAVGSVGTASPFTVYGHFDCSPVGYTPESAQSLATAHLMAREEARVEQALWTGDLGNTPNLQGATALGAAGVDAALGIGLLEDWGAANYGSLGVIHMMRSTAETLLGKKVLNSSGGKLTTGLGTPVAAGSGYPGTSPAGAAAAAGKAWAYITPAMFGYRGDPFTSSNRPGDLFDKARNILYAVAERTYLLGFDPCGVAAVQINLP